MIRFRKAGGGNGLEFLALTKTGGFILGPVSSALGVIMDMLFKFTSAFGVMNIGLCIILFTLVVKVLMFPLTIKQQKSSKLMSVMQPELNAIQKKYKGKNDQQSMMMMQTETKAVYEKYGTSMTGGCLQMVIQLPIMFALYRVIYNIPAYVSSVKVYFENVVNAIGGMDAAQTLTQFATDNKISMAMIKEITDTDKIIDLLYMLTPAQWGQLEGLFPAAANVIQENAAQIESMNYFFGINLATAPWTGFTPTAAWLIPILAGLTQWLSTKLMSSQQNIDENAPGANMMKQMNIMMPLMSVFFCFTFSSGVGIYWIASSVFMIIQQLIVNAYLNKIDIDEMVKKNLEKANKKRAKQGLPPIKEGKNVSVKAIQEATEKEEQAKLAKIARSQAQVKESNEYYSKDAKPGSLAAKAGMVKKYNEKHEKQK